MINETEGSKSDVVVESKGPSLVKRIWRHRHTRTGITVLVGAGLGIGSLLLGQKLTLSAPVVIPPPVA
jgi:hypothetical protein